jgi:UPF0716 protein FxsA
VGRLLLLFIAVPAVELMLLIEVGARIGTLPTLGIIVATGVIGAALARQQGLRAFGTVQARLAAGELPASALIDGVIILVAGALLMTPGILTDAVGFLCLVPATRGALKRRLVRRFEQAIAEQRIHVATAVASADAGRGPVYDIDPVRSPAEDD